MQSPVISRCEIHLRCRRDCAEIVQLPLGCLQVQLSDGARATHHGGIGNGRVCSDSTKWPSTVVINAWVFEGLLRQYEHTSQNAPRCTHAPSTTLLDHFVESEQTRPLWISPVRALRPPSDGNASRWPGRRCTISAQSRLHLEGNLAPTMDIMLYFKSVLRFTQTVTEY